MKRLCTAVMALAFAGLAAATEFKNFAVDQPVADNLVGIGHYQVQLPQGSWKVVSKGTFRSNTLGTGNPAPPAQNLVVARTEGSRILAIIFFAAPESTFQNTSKWSDDPCKIETIAVVKDTLEQTFAMPECFTVSDFGPERVQNIRSTAMADTQKWAQTANMTLPAHFVRLFYAKYHGGDYFRTTVFLAGDATNIPGAETWGRAGVASLSPMVKGKSSPGVWPALPAFVK